jgi:anti-sigma B factor antagonist
VGMEIREHRQGAVLVLKPIGPLVSGDAEDFSLQMERASARNLGRVVVDISAMPYVDSKGLEALVTAAESMQAIGSALRLCGTNETVREVLEITELSAMFEHYSDAHDAARSFL